MSQYVSYIKSIVFAFLFLGGTVIALWLLAIQISAMGDALNDAIQIVSDDERFTEEYNSLATLLLSTKDEREQLEVFILKDEHDTIQLLSEIDQLAAQKKVELETSRLDTKETEGAFDELSATFLITGADSSVMQLVEALESLPYHSNLTELSIARQSSKETGVTETVANVSLVLSIQKHD